MKDSLGRNIDYLRISLTDRCNLRCRYCMPADGVSQISHDDILRIEEIARIVQVAASLGFSHIRLTGGEPLVRKGVVSLVRSIREIPGIQDISLTTNGILLPKYAAGLKEAGLNRVNISLDALDEERYRLVTRCGHVADALDGIDAALDAGFSPVKINAVAIRSLDQDFYAFARMSEDRPLHIRFIEYMPVGASAGMDDCGWDASDVIPCAEILDAINHAAMQAGGPLLQPVSSDQGPLGCGPARYYRFPDAAGTVGFISPLSNHFCGECNRLRLTADGKLRPCLFSDTEFDVREAVRTGSDYDIADAFRRAIGQKPDEHHNKVGTERKMSQIGG